MAEPDAPLRPATTPTYEDPPAVWLGKNWAGLSALVIGAVGFMVAFMIQDPLWSAPDRRLTVPVLVVTLVAAVLSLARREGSKILPVAGLALAACAMVLGWFLVMATIVGITAILILIISLVM